MAHLKRTVNNPLNPSGPPIVVIPRISYQDAPSELRRYVRHDAVECHYGSACQEEADEENERLDEESDVEYGHKLSIDHDEDDEEQGPSAVVDEAKGQEQIRLDEFRDIAEGNVEHRQGQEQPQERPRWIRKPKSPPYEIILVDSSTSPEDEQEEQQQQPSPTWELRRAKAYKKARRKEPIREVIVVDSSSSSSFSSSSQGQDVKTENFQKMPRQKASAKRDEDVEEEHDMKNTERRPKAKARKKALVSKARDIYGENIYDVPPTMKSKSGGLKEKKRGAYIPRQTALEGEAIKLKGTTQAKPKPKRKDVSQTVIEAADFHDDMVESQQKPRLRKKAPVRRAKIDSEDESNDPQGMTTPRRKARKPYTPGTIIMNSTLDNEELVDKSTRRLGYLKLPESEESEEYATCKPKSRSGAISRGRGGGAAARVRGNLTGKAARTTVSRQSMLRERGPSILEEEMARHGVSTRREDDELMM